MNLTLPAQPLPFESPVLPFRFKVAVSSCGDMSVNCASVQMCALQPFAGVVYSEPSVTFKDCLLLLPHAMKPVFPSPFSSMDSFFCPSPSVMPTVTQES